MGSFFCGSTSGESTACNNGLISNLHDFSGLSLSELQKSLELLLISDPTSAIRYGSNVLSRLENTLDENSDTIWSLRRIVALAAEDRYPRSALSFWNTILDESPDEAAHEEAIGHIKRLKDEFVARSMKKIPIGEITV